MIRMPPHAHRSATRWSPTLPLPCRGCWNSYRRPTGARPVLAVSGDGGAQYGIQGLYTAASRRLPVTFLVLVNQEYGILKGFGDYLTTTGVPGLDLDYLDYEALAKGYGIPAVRAGRPDELAIALKQAFTAGNGPHMIIVDVAPGVRLGA